MGNAGILFIGLTGAAEIALAQSAAEEAGLESKVWETGSIPPTGSPSVLLLDTALPGPNAYEVARSCSGTPGLRVVLVAPPDREREARDLARCVGAAILFKPLSSRGLTTLLASRPAKGPTSEQPLPEGIDAKRFADRLLAGRGGAESPASRLVAQLTEPDTGLFLSAYMSLRLDEECKRAFRFQHPLSAALLGLEGPAPEAPLDLVRGLSGRLLGETRDIDSLGHWEGGRLLLLLPGTPAAGARAMLNRILPGLSPLLEECPGWCVFGGVAAHPLGEGTAPGSLPDETRVLRSGPETLLEEAEAALAQARESAPAGARTGLAGPWA